MSLTPIDSAHDMSSPGILKIFSPDFPYFLIFVQILILGPSQISLLPFMKYGMDSKSIQSHILSSDVKLTQKLFSIFCRDLTSVNGTMMNGFPWVG